MNPTVASSGLDPVTMMGWMAAVVGGTWGVLMALGRHIDRRVEEKLRLAEARADNRHQAVMSTLQGLVIRLKASGALQEHEMPSPSGRWPIAASHRNDEERS